MKDKIMKKLEDYKTALTQLINQEKALRVAIQVCEQLLNDKPEDKNKEEKEVK